MNLRICAIVLVATIGLGSNPPAFADTGLRWLNHSPVRFFTDQDWQAAKDAARRALDTAADGTTVDWKNPASGNHGSLTPLDTTTGDGRHCRQMKVENHTDHLSGSALFKFCRQADGQWRVEQGPPPGRS